MVDAIPPATNRLRLVEIGQELAAIFGAVGLVAGAPVLPDLTPGIGPYSLVVFDGSALRAVPDAKLGRLFSEARLRRLRVAVRRAGPHAQRFARFGAQFLGSAA